MAKKSVKNQAENGQETVQKMLEKKGRIFTIMQYEKKPLTNEDLNFNETNIQAGLVYRSIKQWAYIRHDKDKFTAEDMEKVREKAQALGIENVSDIKPVHWHIVLKCSQLISIGQISKWFNVNPHRVRIVKGRHAFIENCIYLTHEDEKQQLAGKHRYEDKEVKTSADFDFRKTVDDFKERQIKFDRELSRKEQIRYEVLHEGKTIRQVMKEYPEDIINDLSTIERLRMKYITENAELPPVRINYYIYAEDQKEGGGIGKGLLSRAIARSLYPNLEREEDVFFEVGSDGSTFDGYDGQPVIIWNDRRGAQILHELGGKVDNVFNVFDTTPTSQKQNVKYSAVKLINEVNIVNSVQSFEDFVDGLMGINGNYYTEDKGQALRRFPIIIPMRYEDFKILLNKGFFENSREFYQYNKYAEICVNMQRLQQAGRGNRTAVKEAEFKLLEPLVNKHNEVVEKRKPTNEAVTVEEILEGVVVKTFENVQCKNCDKWFDKSVENPDMYLDICPDCLAIIRGIK